ncbi:cobalamin B12-binding domain-containing protein [Acetobacterium tundrae]|uniref:Cobalamin-binding protein n=1 Tax=Acetobacterium tundrae TaxID=132932 RepID=A0ABR6WHC6_9FIRM|nr:cobalamin-dependent protein [Acetobacterium tundrae]MBC3795876.1 cobalamin-binding protein [Acetobacterium tundrae]
MKDKLIELIADLKVDEAEAFASELIHSGIDYKVLFERVMAGLAEIGKKYENEQCFIADLIVSGMMAKNIFAEANLYQENQEPPNTLGMVVMGTIYDDIHDIGKDLMIDALENKGIKVIDLGVDVRVEKYIDAVRQNDPDIIAVSCVMVNSISYVEELGIALQRENLLENRRFILGGASVDNDYIRIPQVDFMSNNFYEGVNYCESFLREKYKGRNEVNE